MGRGASDDGRPEECEFPCSIPAHRPSGVSVLTSLAGSKVIAMDAEEAVETIDAAVGTDLNRRTVRAIDEYMTVLEGEGPHSYAVYSQSGQCYEIDGATGTCSCPDHQQRDLKCKHLQRVHLETAQEPERWQAVTSDLGTALLDVDAEITRLEQQIADLQAAQRALGRLVDRLEELRPADSEGIDAAPADPQGVAPLADD